MLLSRNVIFVFFLLIGMPTTAFGEELGLWAGVGAANLNTVKSGGLWGPGVQIGVHYQISDFWMLSSSFGASHHFESSELQSDESTIVFPADTVMDASLRLRYLIDIVKYIPYFGLGPTLYLDLPRVDDAEPLVNLGASLVLGVDWRYSRHASVGIFAELHAIASDLGRYPVYSIAGFRYVTHFRF